MVEKNNKNIKILLDQLKLDLWELSTWAEGVGDNEDWLSPPFDLWNVENWNDMYDAITMIHNYLDIIEKNRNVQQIDAQLGGTNDVAN